MIIPNTTPRNISVKGSTVLPLETIAFVLWQLGHTGNHASHGLSIDRFGIFFLLAFALPWGAADNPLAELGLSKRVVSIRFQIRWMNIATYINGDTAIDRGLFVNRDQGDLPNIMGDSVTDLHLREMRHAFAIHTTTSSRLPLFTIVSLTDDVRSLFEDRSRNATLENDAPKAKLRACHPGTLTGIWVFLVKFSLSIEMILKKWTRSLDQLDRTLAMSVSVAISSMVSPNP